MRNLQENLISPPILAVSYVEWKMKMDRDTSYGRVGCVVLQELPDKTTKPIWYWSRLLESAEHLYDSTRRECLATV